MNHILSNRY
ncbi:hypothetical protein V3C99_008497 [Haemonchus contortus]